MTEAADRTPDMIWLLMALILPLMALMGRRIALGQALSMLLIWVAIFGAGFAIFKLVEPRLIAWQQSQRGGEIVATVSRADSGSPQGETVRLAMSPDGHFWTEARINGQPIRLLVDSGASITAISAATATRIGIDIDSFSPPMELTTANGTVQAQRATVDTLRIGAVEARDLPVVVSGAFGDTNVVGMNFLTKLKSWRVEGTTMILEAP